MKIVHHTSTFLALEQQPTKFTKVTEIGMCAIGVGFFIWVLTLAKGLPWYAIAIGLLCPLFIFYLALRATTSIVCTFDRKLNLLLLKRENWFGEKVVRYPLNEIRDVRCKVIRGSEETDTYEIGIFLTSGSYVCLNEPTTSFDRHNTESIVSSIASFLNLYHLNV
jgi:hypothetical protein